MKPSDPKIKSMQTETKLESRLFNCKAKLPGCSGTGFRIDPLDTVCSFCQNEAKKRVRIF